MKDNLNECQALIVKMFLVWVNDFVTVDAFANHYGISTETALCIIQEGCELHELTADSEG